ncbi:hypothetical protein EF910_05500 [Streptomyces sp. WAC07149]|uniref:hypothetical protein n=1 Tax=Streptomyces sp. WAC07149 TaxID=2487425 RepID=UPI000F7AEA21|nr:hypothetical protein [Streptomyces sp. WAC07149]RST07892.1 hypothetical protein EF910_05500 [Streptomyces sp. WAC07149]
MGLVTERIEEFERICVDQREHLDECQECDSSAGAMCSVVNKQLDALADLIRAFTDQEYKAAFGKERRQ